jgi:hypothetical protein
MSTSMKRSTGLALVTCLLLGLLVGSFVLRQARASQPPSKAVASNPVSTREGSAIRTGGETPAATAPAATAPTAQTATSWIHYVEAENAKPGANVRIDKVHGSRKGLDAYADRVSVRPGEVVGLYVSASGPVTVRAIRYGYYGGVGSRVVWTGAFRAHPQPGPRSLRSAIPDAGGAKNTNAIYAPWKLTYRMSTTGWPEGAYLLRLDAGAASRYVQLTVRSGSAAGRILLVNAPMTWQAYNTWGGQGLYGDEQKNFAKRSFAVSFDRPMALNNGSGRFLSSDAPLLYAAERLSIPLAWATDYDVALNPGLLTGATAVVFGGHAEYWTGTMWDAVVTQERRGTNLAFFGSNTAYWRVRLAGRTIGLAGQPDRRDGRPRLIFGPKTTSLDPLAHTDPAGATAHFRSAPHPRLEENLTGQRYDCFPAAGADWVVADASWWGYAGTGLRNGRHLPLAVGAESDRVYPAATRPKPMTVVAYTKFNCGGHVTAQTGVYWTNAAGAGIFATGAMGWLSKVHDPVIGPIVTKVTTNVLTAFSTARAGRVKRVVRDNVSKFWLPAHITTAAAS